MVCRRVAALPHGSRALTWACKISKSSTGHYFNSISNLLPLKMSAPWSPANAVSLVFPESPRSSALVLTVLPHRLPQPSQLTQGGTPTTAPLSLSPASVHHSQRTEKNHWTCFTLWPKAPGNSTLPPPVLWKFLHMLSSQDPRLV